MKTAESAAPTRFAAVTFLLKASLLKARRAAQDSRLRNQRWPSGDQNAFPFLWAESRTPLRADADSIERVMEQGKVQNLRCAVRRLHCVTIPSGEIFSFWRQIGRATRQGGYVAGRQIQEGCILPVVGGGLCQLSNALYDIALQANCEIVERHPHSRTVPGSAAALGRDATVFWNYLDLQFRPSQTVLLDAQLTADTLITRLYGAAKRTQAEPRRLQSLPILPASDEGKSCLSCGVAACFRHSSPAPVLTGQRSERVAYLLDDWSPEFAFWLQSVQTEADTLAIPISGQRWRLPHYAWATENWACVHTATLETLHHAFQARRLTEQGAAQRQAQLHRAEALARRLAKSLTPDCEQAVIAQNLLPFLWRDGALGGRRFRVLLSRQPILTLQANLDAAALLHPNSATLRDFRASDWLADAERAALQAAEQIITPHTYLAALFPRKTCLLPWTLPDAQSRASGSAIFFPGPTVARKGAYELREAARRLDVEIRYSGRDLESENFWTGVRARRLTPDEDGMQGAVVVQPAFIEDRPRALLRAVAANVPVIATDRCGLLKRANVDIVPCGDIEALTTALRRVLSRSEYKV